MPNTIVRVYREKPLTWWAELWRERVGSDPPIPDRRLTDESRPDDIPGYKVVDLRLKMTKWGAIRAGKKMRTLYNGDIKKKDFKEIVFNA
jgi:hypothetical protein